MYFSCNRELDKIYIHTWVYIYIHTFPIACCLLPVAEVVAEATKGSAEEKEDKESVIADEEDGSPIAEIQEGAAAESQDDEAEIVYFMRKTTYSNRKLHYIPLINTLLLILIPF